MAPPSEISGYASLKTFRVARQNVEQPTPIAGSDSIDNGLVFLDHLFLLALEVLKVVRLHLVDEIYQTPRVVMDPAGQFYDELVLGSVCNAGMKLGVVSRYFEELVRGHRLPVFPLDGDEVLNKPRVPEAAQDADSALGNTIRIEEAGGVLKVERRDIETLVRPRFDEPLGDEPVQGLSRGRSADPQLAPEHRFVQLHAGRQRQFENAVAYPVRSDHCERGAWLLCFGHLRRGLSVHRTRIPDYNTNRSRSECLPWVYRDHNRRIGDRPPDRARGDR
jgi:hypothetical protein